MRFQTKRTKAVSRRKFAAAGLAAACAMVLALAGCSSGGSSSQEAEQAAEPAAEEQASLEGKELNIYCGAGMTDPFQEIADAFEAETGCTMNVTFANAAQIQTQITTTEEGDFFIAGSADELKPVSDYVEQQTDLVKHIPVLAVPADNPKNVTGLADLANCERVLVGDPRVHADRQDRPERADQAGAVGCHDGRQRADDDHHRAADLHRARE